MLARMATLADVMTTDVLSVAPRTPSAKRLRR